MLTVLCVIWLHFLADFVCQTDKMATRKSYDTRWLGWHCAVYTACLLLLGPWYALVNGVLHFGVDYITSRWTSKLWSAGERHWFFVVIGLDQAVHMSCLILTWGLL
jgi:hypothetical protein